MERDELIKLFRKRDSRAIEELSRMYGRKMISVSMNIVNNEQDAEECVNDAYLALWNSIPPAEPDDVCAYACETVRNISYKKYRYNTAEKRSAVTVSIDAELADIMPDTVMASDGLDQAVETFLRSLSKKNRIIFMRRYYYLDSVSKIAAMAQMKENAVSGRLHRLRAKLAAHLKKEGFNL